MVEYVTTYEGKKIKRKKIVEKPAEQRLDVSKGTIRKKINEEVFDLADSVADNSKMIILLSYILKELYETLDEEQKEKLNNRFFIEKVLKIFDPENIIDIKLTIEGDAFMERLAERQSKIAEIIKTEAI